MILPIEPNASTYEQIAAAIRAGLTAQLLDELALRRIREGIALQHMMRHAQDMDRERASLKVIEQIVASVMSNLGISRIEHNGLIAQATDAEPKVLLDVPPAELDPEFQVIIPSTIRANLPSIAAALKAGRPVAGARLAEAGKALALTYKETHAAEAHIETAQSGDKPVREADGHRLDNGQVA